MADYVKLSMPRSDAQAMLAALGSAARYEQPRVTLQLFRVIQRLRLALEGKNLRAVNCKHNTHLTAQERQQAARRKWT